MKLEAFVRQKRNHWNRLGMLLTECATGEVSDEKLKDLIRLYRSACADFAYARSAYPYDRIVPELNVLIGRAHKIVYGTRRRGWDRVRQFYASEFPALFRRHQSYFWASMAVFAAAALIAFLACMGNPDLPRVILGDRYVEITRENIQSNNPFAIYSSEDSPIMSTFIMTNNIKVTFFAFGMGLLMGFGTLYVLFYNGLMFGMFLFLFFEHHLLLDALLTVMMHGGIELTCIFIAGGAGLLVGKALLFPGPFPRRDALRNNGLHAVQLILGIIPLLVLAALIEGFVTRVSLAWPWRLAFVSATFLFLVWYLGTRAQLSPRPKHRLSTMPLTHPS